jgi:hypothetical protein
MLSLTLIGAEDEHIQGPSALLLRALPFGLNLNRWRSTGSATAQTLLYSVGQIKRVTVSDTPNITRMNSRLRSGRRKRSRFGKRGDSETDEIARDLFSRSITRFVADPHR